MGLTTYLSVFLQIPSLLSQLALPAWAELPLDLCLNLLFITQSMLMLRSFYYANGTSSHVVQTKELLEQMLEYKEQLKQVKKQERQQEFLV